LAVKTCRLAITAGSKGCSIAPDKSDFKEEKISTLYFCISQVVCCKLKEKRLMLNLEKFDDNLY